MVNRWEGFHDAEMAMTDTFPESGEVEVAMTYRSNGQTVDLRELPHLGVFAEDEPPDTEMYIWRKDTETGLYVAGGVVVDVDEEKLRHDRENAISWLESYDPVVVIGQPWEAHNEEGVNVWGGHPVGSLSFVLREGMPAQDFYAIIQPELPTPVTPGPTILRTTVMRALGRETSLPELATEFRQR